MNTQKHKNNPTAFFMKNEENLPPEVEEKMKKFSESLFDSQKCVLCKCDYDIDIHIPRIMIHCGHTFCTKCVSTFYKKRKVRCPLCLKLVKHLTTVERLPVNHHIFVKVGQEFKAKLKKEGYPKLDEIDHYINQKLNESFLRSKDDQRAYEPEPELPPEYFNAGQKVQKQQPIEHQLPPDYFINGPPKQQQQGQFLKQKDLNIYAQQKQQIHLQHQEMDPYRDMYNLGAGNRGTSM